METTPTQSSNDVYPSIMELMPKSLHAIIPVSLAQEISERYETLGPKYLTEAVTEDGRRVNGMMFTSRIQNCREEVVDAVFCVLGWIFKTSNDISIDGSKIQLQEEPPDSAYEALRGLIQVYGILVAEYERDQSI